MKPPAKIALVVAVVVVVVAAVGIFWFLRDDSPPEADLAATASSLRDNTTTSTTIGDAGAAEGGDATATDADVSGTWTVDVETGEFDYESATGTFAGVRIQEVLATVGSTTAVARTGNVTGTVDIDATTVTAADIEVDMTALTSNDGRRDNRMHEAIGSAEFPTATFSLTEPIDLPGAALRGDAVQVTATGDLTVHGVTRSVDLTVEAQLVDDVIVMTASTPITFSDFDVEVPDAPIVVSVEDSGVLELQLLLVRS